MRIKQHITVKQYQELLEIIPTDIKMGEFAEILNLTIGEISSHMIKQRNTVQKLITIGRMIDILDNYFEFIEMQSCGSVELEHNHYVEDNLCDALWEAVKSTLRLEYNNVND